SQTLDTPPFAISATASSGLAVAFTSATTSVCTISGATVTLVSAGTCTIAADQAGNASYNPAPQVTQSFAVAQGGQVITYTYDAIGRAVQVATADGTSNQFSYDAVGNITAVTDN